MDFLPSYISSIPATRACRYGVLVTANLFVVSALSAAVTVSVDFTDASVQASPIYDFWSVRNQLNPYPSATFVASNRSIDGGKLYSFTG